MRMRSNRVPGLSFLQHTVLLKQSGKRALAIGRPTCYEKWKVSVIWLLFKYLRSRQIPPPRFPKLPGSCGSCI